MSGDPIELTNPTSIERPDFGLGVGDSSPSAGTTAPQRYGVAMAANRVSDGEREVEDPIHEMVRRVMADPRVIARMDACDEREGRGEFAEPVPDNVVRKIVGLPPLPDRG